MSSKNAPDFVDIILESKIKVPFSNISAGADIKKRSNIGRYIGQPFISAININIADYIGRKRLELGLQRGGIFLVRVQKVSK